MTEQRSEKDIRLITASNRLPRLKRQSTLLDKILCLSPGIAYRYVVVGVVASFLQINESSCNPNEVLRGIPCKLYEYSVGLSGNHNRA